MEKFKVKITDEALEDMEKIYEYIADILLIPKSAIECYNKIADAILTLSTMPERFELFDSEPECSWGLHRMIVDNYLVCYIVDFDVVTVTDVLYGASDIHTRLQDRHTTE